MPAPTNERQALERERAELPSQLAHYQRELDATPQENRERRERLAWQIRRAEKRMAEIEASNMNTIPAPPSLRLLEADLAFIMRNHQDLVIKHAPKNPTPDEVSYLRVAVSLWLTLTEHCNAITLLLRHGFLDSAKAVNRSAYETAIHLVYLVTVGNKYENARVYEARLKLEYISISELPPAYSVENRREFDSLPIEIRERAIKSKKDRREWSGKPLAEMAKAIHIRGHKGAFAVQSWATHGHSGLNETQGIEGPEGATFWRQPPDTVDFEMVTMHTRRTVLWPTYHVATKDFYGPVPPLPTPPPPNPPERPSDTAAPSP